MKGSALILLALCSNLSGRADQPSEPELHRAVRGLPGLAEITVPTGHCNVETALSSHVKPCANQRTLRLVLRWKNRGHAYLQNPIVELPFGSIERATPDADTATATSNIELGKAQTRLELAWSLRFQPKIKLQGMKSARQTTVLSTHDAPTIVWPLCEEPRLSPPAATDPLVTESLDCVSGDQSTVTLTATIETSVVDLTELWPEAAKGIDFVDRGQREDPLAIWTAADPTHAKMRLLGSTSGDPTLWSAYIPSADTDPAKSDMPLARFVVYPFEIAAFDPPVGTASLRHTLLYADKFLISDCLHPAAKPAPGTECHYAYDPKTGEHTNWIPTGFGPALEATGKRGLVLVPWVSTAQDTVGKHSDLPGRTLAMIHLLQNERLIGTQNRKPLNSPLVLAGYSGGGEGMLAAFKKYKSEVQAVWGFDPISHTAGKGAGVSRKQLDELAAWLKADPSHQLRVVTTQYEGSWNALFWRLRGTTVLPAQMTHETVQTSKEAMRWAESQDLRDQGIWALHQFAFNGGRENLNGKRTSYFEQFTNLLP